MPSESDIDPATPVVFCRRGTHFPESTAYQDTIVSLLRNDRLVVSRVHIGFNCADRPVLSAMRVSEPVDGQNPTLELCAAEKFGQERQCVPLRLWEMKRAIDDDAIAIHAKQR